MTESQFSENFGTERTVMWYASSDGIAKHKGTDHSCPRRAMKLLA